MSESSLQNLDQKTRINAMISYFFLGWIFLLARRNPDFSHPFIRSHAKKATRLHLGLLGGFILYSLYLAKYIPSFSIPIIPILTLDKIISVAFFVLLALFIVRGAYLSFHGKTTDETSTMKLREAFAHENITLSGFSETDKIVFLSSYIPLIGIITASRHMNPVTRIGVKMSSIWLFLTLLLSTTTGDYSEVSWILLFIYLLYVTFVGVSFFLYDVVPGFVFLEKIPNLTDVYIFSRAIFPYSWRLLAIIFGKKEELNFSMIMQDIRNKDVEYQELAKTHFMDVVLPFHQNLIFIPILNLIFIPQLYLRKNSRYILAILQGGIISLGLVILWIVFGFSTLWQTFFLFPIFLGIANLETNPFYKIPLIYEIYILLDFLTFSMSGRIGKLKEKHKESAKVSFKV